MKRILIKYPDGLRMLIGIVDGNITIVGPMARDIPKAWMSYYEPMRAKVYSLENLKLLEKEGFIETQDYDPTFDDFWKAYCGIKNQSTKTGTTGSGSKAKAMSVWDKLSLDHRRKAFAYLTEYKKYLEQAQPTRPKLDGSTYLNPLKADWNL